MAYTALEVQEIFRRIYDSDNNALRISGGGGGGSPGGSDTQIQYNNGGSFGGTTNLTFNDSTGVLSIAQAADNKGLDIDSNATTSTNYAFEVSTDSGARTMHVLQAGDQKALFLENTSASNSSSLVDIQNNGNGVTLDVQTTGTATGVLIDQDGEGIALHIDSAATTSNALLLPQNDYSTKPTLAFGDGDTGFFESSDDGRCP